MRKAVKRVRSNVDDEKKTSTSNGEVKIPRTDEPVSHSKYFTNDSNRPGASNNRLEFSFFDRPCKDLAAALLGQTVVAMVDGQRVAGKIVETEAYLGLEDKAAHSYNGKRTSRNEAMFMAPGTAYVYNIYGMYCCLNISSQGMLKIS